MGCVCALQGRVSKFHFRRFPLTVGKHKLFWNQGALNKAPCGHWADWVPVILSTLWSQDQEPLALGRARHDPLTSRERGLAGNFLPPGPLSQACFPPQVFAFARSQRSYLLREVSGPSSKMWLTSFLSLFRVLGPIGARFQKPVAGKPLG